MLCFLNQQLIFFESANGCPTLHSTSLSTVTMCARLATVYYQRVVSLFNDALNPISTQRVRVDGCKRAPDLFLLPLNSIKFDICLHLISTEPFSYSVPQKLYQQLNLFSVSLLQDFFITISRV